MDRKDVPAALIWSNIQASPALKRTELLTKSMLVESHLQLCQHTPPSFGTGVCLHAYLHSHKGRYVHTCLSKLALNVCSFMPILRNWLLNRTNIIINMLPGARQCQRVSQRKRGACRKGLTVISRQAGGFPVQICTDIRKTKSELSKSQSQQLQQNNFPARGLTSLMCVGVCVCVSVCV